MCVCVCVCVFFYVCNLHNGLHLLNVNVLKGLTVARTIIIDTPTPQHRYHLGYDGPQYGPGHSSILYIYTSSCLSVYINTYTLSIHLSTRSSAAHFLANPFMRMDNLTITEYITSYQSDLISTICAYSSFYVVFSPVLISTAMSIRFLSIE